MHTSIIAIISHHAKTRTSMRVLQTHLCYQFVRLSGSGLSHACQNPVMRWKREAFGSKYINWYGFWWIHVLMLGMRTGSRRPSISKSRYTTASGLYNATAAKELWSLQASIEKERRTFLFFYNWNLT